MFWFEIAYLNLDRYLVLNTVKQGYFDCLIDFRSFSKISVFKLTMGYSRKNPKRGVWEYGISRGIKEILWNFWGLIKNEVEFPRETKKNSPIPAFLYQVRRTFRFFSVASSNLVLGYKWLLVVNLHETMTGRSKWHHSLGFVLSNKDERGIGQLFMRNLNREI